MCMYSFPNSASRIAQRTFFSHTHTHKRKYIDKGTPHLENAIVYIPYRLGMKLRDVAIELESLISVGMTGS